MRGQTVTGQDVILNITIYGTVIKHTGNTLNLNYRGTRVHVWIHPPLSYVLSDDLTVLGQALLSYRIQ